MNDALKKLIINYGLEKDQRVNPSQFDIAKGFKNLRRRFFRYVKEFILISLGIASAAFGLESFLLPNQFIDGGATGISLLISEVGRFSISYLIVLINLPFMWLAYKTIGPKFAVKPVLAIPGLAVVISSAHFPEVTHEKLLVAVFGGFFLGAGIGLCIRGGGVIDGTEVLAIFLSKKLGTTIGDIIIIINIIVFSVAAYLLSVETALYSMITYLAASKTLDFIIEGIEEYTGVTIISVRNEEIRKMIIEKMGRGVTLYTGKSGYGKSGEVLERDIIFTVVTRLELSKLNAEIDRIDANAFVTMTGLKDTKGGMIKKRAHKH